MSFANYEFSIFSNAVPLGQFLIQKYDYKTNFMRGKINFSTRYTVYDR